jgi:hypothetical protein
MGVTVMEQMATALSFTNNRRPAIGARQIAVRKGIRRTGQYAESE